MQILYKQDNHSATVVLEVIRLSKNKKINKGYNLCGDLERKIRDLLEDNFEKDNRYNSKKGWIFRKISDRITLDYTYEEEHLIPREIHYHIYQGQSEKLDEILNFSELNHISAKEGIGNNLKEKYDGMHDKNIRKLLKL